jgi:hypothetical protein
VVVMLDCISQIHVFVQSMIKDSEPKSKASTKFIERITKHSMGET